MNKQEILQVIKLAVENLKAQQFILENSAGEVEQSLIDTFEDNNL